jgi:hypothetical protein
MARLYPGDKAQLNSPDLTPQPDDPSREGSSASPPSQPGPGAERPPDVPSSLTDYLPRDAPDEQDVGPGQEPFEGVMEERWKEGWKDRWKEQWREEWKERWKERWKK